MTHDTQDDYASQTVELILYPWDVMGATESGALEKVHANEISHVPVQRRIPLHIRLCCVVIPSFPHFR